MLWYFREKSQFLALSGKDGSMLWHHVAELDGPRRSRAARESEIAGEPAMMDVDHDGAAGHHRDDPVRRIGRGEQTAAGASPGLESDANRQFFFRRVVMAISGRSGTRLWSYAIDEEFTLPREQLRQAKPPAELVQAGRTSLIAVLDDEKWLGLDPATGRVRAGPIDLGFAPVRPVPHADLDGDGEPEIAGARA